jgi:hypothetical protein
MNILKGYIIISFFGQLENVFEKYGLIKRLSIDAYDFFSINHSHEYHYDYLSKVTLSTNKNVLIKKDENLSDEIFDIHTIKLSDNEINDLVSELESKFDKFINDHKIKLEINITCEKEIRLNKECLKLLENNKLKLYPSVNIDAVTKDINTHENGTKAIIKLNCNILIRKKEISEFNWNLW